MKKKLNNYARFYALLRRLPGDTEENKRALVERFTEGRTTSLREMRREEYEAMCRTVEAERLQGGHAAKDFNAEIKRFRSAALRRMQKIGVDTTDWAQVDAFCLDPRIAGKRFRYLSIAELEALIPKLEAIRRKPNPSSGARQKSPRVVHVFINPNQIPS